MFVCGNRDSVLSISVKLDSCMIATVVSAIRNVKIPSLVLNNSHTQTPTVECLELLSDIPPQSLKLYHYLLPTKEESRLM